MDRINNERKYKKIHNNTNKNIHKNIKNQDKKLQ